ncbi:MAG TPA: RNA 2',3'-cyclic phosphodiesterase [Candidatus Binatia bacterium]|nr:RNA 2',3'-cyclic phosphodiesterase [Candidatus Binatia bacterium]
MIRAFIAVNLASPVIEEIAKVRSALQEAKGDIRWTRLEGLHLTLKFLGDIERHQVEPILRVMNETMGKWPPLHILAQGLGAFPNLRRPRVLWAGLSGEGLRGMSEALETALMPLDFPPEEREFTPHLTLGRVRSLRGWEHVLAVVKEYEQTRFGESRVDQVTLYQSALRPDGAVYSPLGSAPLRQS